MIRNVGSDGPETFSIKILDSLFPVSIAALKPLKRKRHDPPGLAELRSGFQRRAQYIALQFGFMGFPRRATERKIEKNSSGRLKRQTSFPKRAHA